MPCNCGGNKVVTPPKANSGQNIVGLMSSKAVVQGDDSVSDNDFELVKYTHPNRGQHPVYGTATRNFYGHRGGGSVFLVHRSDIAAAPNLFQIVNKVPAAPATPVPPPPPPEALSNIKPVNIGISVAEEVDLSESTADEPTVIDKAVKNAKFDIELIPGVTPAVAKGLAAHGLVSPESIIKAGKQGLLQVKGIADKRAEVILGFVEEKYA